MVVPQKGDVLELRKRIANRQYLFHAHVTGISERPDHFIVRVKPTDPSENCVGFCLNKNGDWPRIGIVAMGIINFAKRKRNAPRLTNPEFVLC